MDPEQQDAPFLAHTQEYLSSVKVFPLIYHLKKDVTVSLSCSQINSVFLINYRDRFGAAQKDIGELGIFIPNVIVDCVLTFFR